MTATPQTTHITTATGGRGTSHSDAFIALVLPRIVFLPVPPMPNSDTELPLQIASVPAGWD
jgi:hypothetical protein